MTPNDEMVEAVAKAGYEYSAEGIDPQLVVSWDERQEHAKETARQKARAQIAAMKDSDVYKAGFEAGRASADGNEFVFSGLFGQVGALLMNGDAESMLLWFKDGRFNCTFSISNFDEREQNPAIDVAIAGAVVKAEAAAREKGGQGE